MTLQVFYLKIKAHILTSSTHLHRQPQEHFNQSYKNDKL